MTSSDAYLEGIIIDYETPSAKRSAEGSSSLETRWRDDRILRDGKY